MYDSYRDASNKLNINVSRIAECMTGKKESRHGYTFEKVAK